MISLDTTGIESMLGIPSATIRTWRAAGLLDGLGELDDSGRWTYGPGDLAIIAVAARLARSGLSPVAAFRVGRIAGGEIAKAMTGQNSREYVFFTPNGGDVLVRLGHRTSDALDAGLAIWSTISVDLVAHEIGELVSNKFRRPAQIVRVPA